MNKFLPYDSYHLFTHFNIQVPEEVLVVDDDNSDGSVHSHIFSTSKAPPKIPPTLTRQKKAQAQKTPTKVAPRVSPTVQDDVEDVLTSRDSKRTPTSSPPPMDLQVFVHTPPYYIRVSLRHVI